jgi:sterol desaturase/sphingolipid hydroxylase (fatty acid hydroxylase superfamily)
VSYLLGKLSATFLSLDSAFSLTSLFCALCLATGFLVLKRRQKNRRVRIKTIVRALFPKRIAASPSHSADVGYFFFNIFVFGIVFGWAVLSYQVLSNLVIEGLVSTFGATQPTALPDVVARLAITATLFLAYELAYWIDHYLSHRVPLLWEFHKVHHTATVLTPLTLFRVHPVDGMVHGNILAVVMATANGAMNYLFGKTTYQYAFTDTNAILVLCVHAYVHLQHTHLWIPFRGVLGCILLSPAHHQVHHSRNPVHFNKNLGSCLAVWDWLFGTLHIPGKEPEKLHFGVAPADAAHANAHSMAGALVEPVYRALSLLPRKSSTSLRVGARAIPPKRVHLTAAAAVANDSASFSPQPCANASANAP